MFYSLCFLHIQVVISPEIFRKKRGFFVLSTTIYVNIMLYNVSSLFDMLNI